MKLRGLAINLAWSQLKNIRNLGLSKGMSGILVVLPLLSSVVLALESYESVSVPIPVNMFVLYIAALSFFVGNIIFDLICPKIILNHFNKHAFVQHCLTQSRLVLEYKNLQEPQGHITKNLAKKMGEVVESDDADLLEEYEKVLRNYAEVEFSNDLLKVWRDSNATAQGSKLAWVTAGLYALSFILNGFVALVDAPLRVFKVLLI